MEHASRWTKRRAGTTQIGAKPDPAIGATDGEGGKIGLQKNHKIKKGVEREGDEENTQRAEDIK